MPQQIDFNKEPQFASPSMPDDYKNNINAPPLPSSSSPKTNIHSSASLPPPSIPNDDRNRNKLPALPQESEHDEYSSEFSKMSQNKGSQSNSYNVATMPSKIDFNRQPQLPIPSMPDDADNMMLSPPPLPNENENNNLKMKINSSAISPPSSCIPPPAPTEAAPSPNLPSINIKKKKTKKKKKQSV
eukprot:493225_1